MNAKKKGMNAGFAEISILDGKGVSLFEGSLSDISFSEKLIVSKSIQFFHDPDPCFIHRSAVVVRLISELDLLLRASPEISIEQLEETSLGYLGEYGGAKYIRAKKVRA
jgi:hypothetical protein